MRKNDWAKTLLYVYKYLDRIADGIDTLVMRNALNSFYVQGNKQSENGVQAVSERIINLSARKAKLVNIKYLANKALKQMEREEAQLLIERYMDNDPSELIAERHNLNVRTYYRRLYQAELCFSQVLTTEGFNEEKLKVYLADEKWIMEVYEDFVTEKFSFLSVR